MSPHIPDTPAPTPLPVISDADKNKAAQDKANQIMASGRNTTTNQMGFSGSAGNPGLLGSAGNQVRSSVVTG